METVFQFEQLLYTSFVGVGLRLVTSPGVTPDRQQSFLQSVVQVRWDSYDPPRPGFRGIFVQQEAEDACLFGWLYSEPSDDMGRPCVPYFLAHLLTAPLHAPLLDLLLAVLHKGPPEAPSRQSLPVLSPLPAPDLWFYPPARPGLRPGGTLVDAAHTALAERRPVVLFAGLSATEMVAEFNARTSERLTRALTRHVGPLAGVIVRQVIARSASVADPRRRALQVCRDLAAQVDDPQAAGALRAELEQVLNLSATSP